MNSNDTDDDPTRRRLGRLTALAGVMAIPLLVIWWPGCRQYPAVTSKESLGLMKLLYAASNTKDDKRLSKVELGVEKALREGKLSEAEQKAFAAIIAMAKAGDWVRAEQAAFKFAQDQIGQGSAKTQVHDHSHEHDHDKSVTRSKATGR